MPRGTEVSARRFLPTVFSLGEAERHQGGFVDRGRDYETVVALISRKSRAGFRPHQAVNCTMVIPLVAQRHLHILQHLAGSEIVVTVDRFAVAVAIVGRIVPVGWIPITAPPIIIAAAKQD